MLKFNPVAISIFFGIGMAVFAVPDRVEAQQFACGGYPGERQIGLLPGPGGSGPIPMCVRDAPNDRPSPEPATDNDPGAYANTPAFRAARRAANTPAGRAAALERETRNRQALVDRQLRLLGELANSAESVEVLSNSPRFAELRDGAWQQYQEGDPPVPGQKCVATFSNMQGLLSISSVGGLQDSAILLLTGPDVPRPADTAIVETTLHQTGERPVRMRAYNWTDRQAGLGTIAYSVPSLQAAIDGMVDQAEVAVDIDGRRAYQLTYSSATVAKADLARCARGDG